MKLQNKKTGEIREIKEILIDGMFNVKSLAELNEDWEDYEELKDFWYIGPDGDLYREPSDDSCEFDNNCREIGNYFETKEEAEKAVEKLKALKRLKDKGFKFDGYGKDSIEFKLDEEYSEYTYNGYDEGVEMFLDRDVEYGLDLLFGGEE